MREPLNVLLSYNVYDIFSAVRIGQIMESHLRKMGIPTLPAEKMKIKGYVRA